MLKSYFATDVGLVRSGNEDNGAVINQNVFVVADGMGGAAAGEKASGILVATAKELLADGGDLRGAIAAANDRIFAAANADARLKGMGTTATLCRVENGRAEFAHVGDSRLYLLHGQELKQMTADHSYVAELVRRGELAPELAETHQMKNLLLRAVGVADTLEIDSGSFAIAAGDKLLLATDGLTNMVSDFDIRDILLYENGDLAQKLVAAALAAGGRDNVTALAVICHAG